MSSSKISFFHYTSKWGFESIIEDGYIQASSRDNNHAHFGEGTYGTSLSPDEGRETIARNNWTHHGKFYVRDGKVRRAIEVRIPEKRVRQVGPCGRDILLYPHGDIELERYKWKVWTVPKDDSDSSPKLLRRSAPRSRQVTPSTVSRRTSGVSHNADPYDTLRAAMLKWHV